jgi:hypothetical protein
LILALGGAGRLDVTEGALARAQPLAIAQTAQVFEQRDDNFAPDEARNVLSQKFDDGALAIGALFAPVSIYGGAIHATNIDARMNGVLAQLSARYQLEDGAFDLEARLRAPKLDGWDEPPPIVTLLWRNGARRIEAEGLTQALLLRALAREVERKAAFDADVRERAAFNRRAKADKFIARRRKEEADFLADRAQAAASRPAQQPPSLKSDPSPSGLY